jgi:hypothetical protein
MIDGLYLMLRVSCCKLDCAWFTSSVIIDRKVSSSGEVSHHQLDSR